MTHLLTATWRPRTGGYAVIATAGVIPPATLLVSDQVLDQAVPGALWPHLQSKLMLQLGHRVGHPVRLADVTWELHPVDEQLAEAL